MLFVVSDINRGIKYLESSMQVIAVVVVMLLSFLTYLFVTKDQPTPSSNKEQPQCIQDATRERLSPWSTTESTNHAIKPIKFNSLPVSMISGLAPTEYHNPQGATDRTPLIQSWDRNGPGEYEHQHAKHHSELIPLVHHDLTNEIQHGH